MVVNKQRCHWFFIGILFVLVSLIGWRINSLLSGPKLVQAQSSGPLIGSHLGYGDITHQRSILDILSENGAEPGFPVTMLISAKASENEVSILAEGIRKYQFFPIVRIENSCDQIDPNEVIGYVRQYFGPNTIITFGNELNHYLDECSGGKNWSQYQTNWRAISNKSNVSPAAIDQYAQILGTLDVNGTVSPQTLLANLTGVYGSDNSIRTANAYGCARTTRSTCTQDAWDTWSEALAGIDGKPYYFTEFSLAPESKDANAPDSDLNSVKEFIETQGPTTGAVKITPLIRDPCDLGEGDWLLYVHGTFLTATGKIVDTATCKASDKTRDSSDFTFYPISKKFEQAVLSQSNSADEIQAAARLAAEALVEEGYGAYCAAKQTLIGSNVGGSVQRWMELHEGQVLELSVNAKETIDTKTGQLPLLRSDAISNSSMGSIENFLGLPSSKVNNEYEEKISGATIFPRMNLQQQCTFKDQYLDIIEKICLNYKEDIANCSLWNPVSGGSFDLRETKAIWEDSGLGCSDLGTPYTQIADQTTLDEMGYQNLLDRFSEISLHMEHSKIMDFLVVSLEQPKYKTGLQIPGLGLWQNLFGGLFNTFRFARGISDEEELTDPYKDNFQNTVRHKVQVIAFPSPAFSFAKSTGEYQYAEPQELELFSLQPQRVNDDYRTQEQAGRDQLMSQLKFVYNKAFNDPNQTIRPIGDVTNDVTSLAAIYLANGAGLNCEDSFAIDTADQIQSSAQYEQSPQHVTQLGLDWYENLFSSFAKLLDPQSFVRFLSSQVLVGERAKEVREAENARLNIYLLTRNNYVPEQMERIKNSLYSQIMLDTIVQAEGELEAVGDSKITSTTLPGGTRAVPKYIEMGGVNLWESNLAEKNFYDPDRDCGTDEDGNPIPPPCDNNSVSAQVGGDPGQLVVPYNRHTFYNTALVGRAIYSYNSPAHNISTCAVDTEDYLLGISVGCGQSGSDTTIPSGDAVAPVAQCQSGNGRITSGETAIHFCSDTQNTCTNIELTDRLKTNPSLCTEYKADLHNIPNWKNPNDSHTPCDELYSYVACTYPKSLIQNKVNSQGIFDTNGTMTACEFVVQRAKTGGVSPRLALAMWGEESGFSHYNTADLGVISQPARNLGAQVDSFVGTLKNKTTYFDFLYQYSEGYRPGTQFCTNEHFPGRLKTYYDYLSKP